MVPRHVQEKLVAELEVLADAV